MIKRALVISLALTSTVVAQQPLPTPPEERKLEFTITRFNHVVEFLAYQKKVLDDQEHLDALQFRYGADLFDLQNQINTPMQEAPPPPPPTNTPPPKTSATPTPKPSPTQAPPSTIREGAPPSNAPATRKAFTPTEATPSPTPAPEPTPGTPNDMPPPKAKVTPLPLGGPGDTGSTDPASARKALGAPTTPEPSPETPPAPVK